MHNVDVPLPPHISFPKLRSVVRIWYMLFREFSLKAVELI